MSLSRRLRNALEATSTLGYACTIFFFPLAAVSLTVGLLFTRFYPASLLYSVWFIYDYRTPYRGGRPIAMLRHLPFWRWIASYFPMKLHKTVDLDATRKSYIFAFHPHGMFVHGGTVNFLSDATGFGRLFPGISMRFAIINGHFKIPIHRDLFLSMGFISPAAESIENVLTKQGPGNGVLIVVGGAPEMPLSSPDEYKLHILNRKGFIRLALQTDSPVVPVFSFGETKLFRLEPSDPNAFIWRCLGRFGVKPPPFITRGSPIMPFLLPMRQAVNVIVGEPIHFNRMPSDFSREEKLKYINSCHEMYLKALRKLYDDNKSRFGDTDTPLIFS